MHDLSRDAIGKWSDQTQAASYVQDASPDLHQPVLHQAGSVKNF